MAKPKKSSLLKKVLFLLISLVLLGLVSGGIFVFKRYQENPEQVFPFPYSFQTEAPAVKVQAPILIIGDRMGSYFGKFKEELATTISQNLDNTIKIQSIAQERFGIHRTLHQLKGLIGWPQILVYQGGSEEFSETKFDPKEIKKININFKRYEDERIQTFLILYPWLSRIAYEPMKRVALPEKPEVTDKIEETEYLRRLETELLLYEKQLTQLVALSKDRNSLLILTTTPINLDIPPKEICDFTSTLDIEKEILVIEEFQKAKNFKMAFATSSKLIKQYAGNAQLFYLHGQIAKNLGLYDEARKSLLEASAYDCSPWRSSEIFNSIIRKVAKDNQVLLFDFAKINERDWSSHQTFFDELHPQNLYYERGMQQLGLVIKNILKL